MIFLIWCIVFSFVMVVKVNMFLKNFLLNIYLINVKVCLKLVMIFLMVFRLMLIWSKLGVIFMVSCFFFCNFECVVDVGCVMMVWVLFKLEDWLYICKLFISFMVVFVLFVSV